MVAVRRQRARESTRTAGADLQAVLDDDDGGTGLGLAIARELAEPSAAHRLETEPGGGSRFELVLPAAPAGLA